MWNTRCKVIRLCTSLEPPNMSGSERVVVRVPGCTRIKCGGAVGDHRQVESASAD